MWLSERRKLQKLEKLKELLSYSNDETTDLYEQGYLCAEEGKSLESCLKTDVDKKFYIDPEFLKSIGETDSDTLKLSETVTIDENSPAHWILKMLKIFRKKEPITATDIITTGFYEKKLEMAMDELKKNSETIFNLLDKYMDENAIPSPHMFLSP